MEGSPGRGGIIAIVVALITVIGGVTTAAVSNWDKLFGSNPAPQAPVDAAPARQDPAPVAGNAVAQNPSAAAPAASGAASESYPNLAGMWNGDEGMIVHFVQEGPDFGFRQYSGEALVGDGRGRLDGRSITYQYRLTNGQMTLTSVCRGAVRGENSIEGICDAGNGTEFRFQMRR